MSKKNNRKCLVCGREYRYCPRCREDKGLPSWLALFHDNNCKVIFEVVNDYCNKIITKTEAKKMLDKCDLSGKKNFKESVANALNEIYVSNTKDVKTINKPQADKE